MGRGHGAPCYINGCGARQCRTRSSTSDNRLAADLVLRADVASSKVLSWLSIWHLTHLGRSVPFYFLIDQVGMVGAATVGFCISIDALEAGLRSLFTPSSGSVLTGGGCCPVRSRQTLGVIS
ncbi:hypothetical protein BHE74_00012098 [Ensete ventricosum]|nr:hypothetical protein BHE74_00012098 [Ensete ventricosum]